MCVCAASASRSLSDVTAPVGVGGELWSSLSDSGSGLPLAALVFCGVQGLPLPPRLYP